VTLIEMLVVVTIIALFAALVAPRMPAPTDAARVTGRRRAQINSFMTALGATNWILERFLQRRGLQALRIKPAEANQWQGPYLPQDIPVDPWAGRISTKYPANIGDEPDLICLGRRWQPGGDGINGDVVAGRVNESWQASSRRHPGGNADCGGHRGPHRQHFVLRWSSGLESLRLTSATDSIVGLLNGANGTALNGASRRSSHRVRSRHSCPFFEPKPALRVARHAAASKSWPVWPKLPEEDDTAPFLLLRL